MSYPFQALVFDQTATPGRLMGWQQTGVCFGVLCARKGASHCRQSLAVFVQRRETAAAASVQQQQQQLEQQQLEQQQQLERGGGGGGGGGSGGGGGGGGGRGRSLHSSGAAGPR